MVKICFILFVCYTVLLLVGSPGTLKVTGYLRGAPLSVNYLVHIPGLGDFQMAQIDAPFDPFSPANKKYKIHFCNQLQFTSKIHF